MPVDHSGREIWKVATATHVSRFESQLGSLGNQEEPKSLTTKMDHIILFAQIICAYHVLEPYTASNLLNYLAKDAFITNLILQVPYTAIKVSF